MYCPICGREIEITIEDDEGNIHYDDYEDDPYSGLWYGIKHPDYANGCVFTDSHYDDAYPTRKSAEKEVHRIINLVNTFRLGNEKSFDELMKKVLNMREEW